jgi:hypothetical protein
MMLRPELGEAESTGAVTGRALMIVQFGHHLISPPIIWRDRVLLLGSEDSHGWAGCPTRIRSARPAL